MIKSYITSFMAHLHATKIQATELRKKGHSLKEIAEKLSISKSTASLWLTSLELNQIAQTRLKEKQILGQYKAILKKRQIKENNNLIAKSKANNIIDNIRLSKEFWKIACTLMWWCEGNKDDIVVRFTSSDPSLVRIFLTSFKFGFNIDESKFRALVHIHSYHNDEIQKKYWSHVTGIPLNKFYASFKKQNTGIRTRDNYQGCVAISYYDAKIAKELFALYNAFTSLRGVR